MLRYISLFYLSVRETPAYILLIEIGLSCTAWAIHKEGFITGFIEGFLFATFMTEAAIRLIYRFK